MLSGEEPSSDLLLSLHTITEELKEGSGPVSFREFLVAVGWQAQETARFSPRILQWKPRICCSHSSMIPNIKPFT